MGSSSITTQIGEDHQLHIFFFPFLALGHMIPVLDMARLFAKRGVKASYVTTEGNATRVRRLIDDAAGSGLPIQLLVMPFPSEDVGLPKGCENTNSLPMSTDGLLQSFYKALRLLRDPFHDLIIQHRPDCVVTDECYPWTVDVAESLGIPRILFNISNHFSVCINDQIEFSNVHLSVSSDTEPFVVPGNLPHKIQLTKAELPKIFHYPRLALDMVRDLDRKSYGIVTNSFDELVPQEYVEILKNTGGINGQKRKIWNIGPVYLCNNQTNAAKAGREGDNDNDDEKRIKKWLDDKDNGSVLYLAFGSECVFSNDQLREMILGLEASDYPFIWVVRGGGGGLDNIEEWLPEGFEQKVEGRGLIIKGWAPQRLILDHQAAGGFMMQCGWNSTMEALNCGVPMITWPLHSEQFITERLIVQVLGMGASALEGVKRTVYADQKEVVKAEAVKRVIERVMGDGEEAREMRRRVKEYQKVLKSVVEQGGSSYNNLTSMIHELSALAKEKRELKTIS